MQELLQGRHLNNLDNLPFAIHLPRRTANERTLSFSSAQWITCITFRNDRDRRRRLERGMGRKNNGGSRDFFEYCWQFTVIYSENGRFRNLEYCLSRWLSCLTITNNSLAILAQKSQPGYARFLIFTDVSFVINFDQL